MTIVGTRATNRDKTSHGDGVCSVGLACESWYRCYPMAKTITRLLG